MLTRRRGRDRRRDPRGRATKRGSHLALTLERLERRSPRATRSASGCRATQNPLEEIGRFLVGPRRTCRIVDAGVPQAARPARSTCRSSRWSSPSNGPARPARSASPAARRRATRSGRRSTRELLKLVREHRSTIVFVNDRRGAERLALRLNELAERGHRPRPPRLARARGAHRRRGDAQGRRAAVPGRDVSRSSSASTWARSTSCCRSSRRSRSRAACSASAAPATASATRRKGRIFPKFRADLLECAVVTKLMREGRIEPTVVPRNALDVLAQQIVAIVASSRGRPVQRRRPLRARHAHALLRRAAAATLLENVLDMLDGRYPSQEFGELRAAHRLGPRRRHDPRAQGRARAGDRQRRHDPRPRAVLASSCPTAAASASSTRRWSTRRAPARRSCSARRRGGSRRSAATASS